MDLAHARCGTQHMLTLHFTIHIHIEFENYNILQDGTRLILKLDKQFFFTRYVLCFCYIYSDLIVGDKKD